MIRSERYLEMKASVILAHPYPLSFNHAIYGTIINILNTFGIVTYAHDLYEEGFDPILTRDELGTDNSNDPLVNKYADELVDSDFLFFIHPNWWGQPPAILKGYIDRVIRPPYAYDFPKGTTGGGLPIEKLSIKYGLIFNTSNTEAKRENEYFKDPLENIWKQCVFGFLGINNYYRKMFRIVADSSEDERKEWLEIVKKDVNRILLSTMQ